MALQINKKQNIQELFNVPQPQPQYKQVQRQDGGFDFYNPQGQKTTIENYVRGTNTNQDQLRQKLAQQGDTQSQQIIATRPQATTPSIPDQIKTAFDKSLLGKGTNLVVDTAKNFVKAPIIIGNTIASLVTGQDENTLGVGNVKNYGEDTLKGFGVNNPNPIVSNVVGGLLTAADLTPLAGMGFSKIGKGAVEAGQGTAKVVKDAVKIIEGTKPKVALKTEIPAPQVSIKQPDINPILKPQVTPIEPAKNGASQQIRTALTDADTVILDELRNIEKQTGQKGLVNKFMYNSNMQRGSNAIANQHFATSENIKNAIGGMSKKEYQSFNDYANARAELNQINRLKQVGSKSVKSSQSKAELERIVKEGSPLSDRYTALNTHYKELAKVWHDAGIIDTPTLNNWLKNDDYLRIQRDMGDLVGNPATGKGKGYQLGSTQAKQKFKGSNRNTMDIGQVAAERTQQVYREATRNKTGTQLVDSLSNAGLARKVSSSEAVNRNTVSVFKNGKKEFYEVSPEIKTAMDNINPYQMNIVMKILSAPGRLLRAGVTGLNPVFIARNLLKDQVGTAINSKNLLATHNPRAFASGLINATQDAVGTSHNAIYQDFLKHYGNQTQYDLTRNIKDTQQVVNRIRGGKMVGVGQALKSPIRSLENIASITEKSTRFQNFRGEYKKAIAQGLSKEQASENAAIAAWQNSVDFSRAGTWGRVINMVLPYWNPATQGVRQMGRTLKTQPIKSALTATALVGTPLAVATAYNLSNPDTAQIYNNIPEYEKDNNLILIPPGTKQNQDGTYDVIKIPLAPGWKDIFMPTRRAMEAFYSDKPADFLKMGTDILQAISGPINVQNGVSGAAGSFMPQAIKPFVQQAANQDMFSGNTIVPDYVNKATDINGNPIAENKKAYASTSGTARMIGDVFNVSPIRVEKFIKDTTGTVGTQVLNTVDGTLAGLGIIPKDQVGGQSIQEGFKKSFGSAQGIKNANASEGSKYFDNLTTATKNLNTNEQAAWTSLHPSSKNFLGDQIYTNDSTYNPAARLDIYNRYPKVFEADKALNDIAKASNKPSNPLFDLAPEQVKIVLEHDNLPPGAKDPQLSTLYNQEWYSQYATDKSNYFTSIQSDLSKQLDTAKSSGDTAKVESLTKSIGKFTSSDNPYPTTDPNLQKVMDSYSALPKGTGARSNWIKANPEAWQAMQNQYAAVDNWQNNQRVKRGLDTTEGQAGKDKGYPTVSLDYGTNGSGGNSGDPTANKYKYAVSINAGGKAASAIKAKTGSAALKKYKVGMKSNPKVSVKKSKV